MIIIIIIKYYQVSVVENKNQLWIERIHYRIFMTNFLSNTYILYKVEIVIFLTITLCSYAKMGFCYLTHFFIGRF